MAWKFRYRYPRRRGDRRLRFEIRQLRKQVRFLVERQRTHDRLSEIRFRNRVGLPLGFRLRRFL